MGLTLITPPAIEPVSVVEAKNHLRVDFADDDALIGRQIVAARERVESFTNRALLTQTWLKTLDHFPGMGYYDSDCSYDTAYPIRGWIELLRPPLLGVTSLQYIDADGVLQTMDPSLYQVDVYSEPGRVALGTTQSFWPWTQWGFPQPVLNAVRITYTAGYGVASVDGAGVTTLPAKFPIRATQAMLLSIAHLYENREEVLTGARAAAIEIPQAAMSLMWSLRASL